MQNQNTAKTANVSRSQRKSPKADNLVTKQQVRQMLKNMRVTKFFNTPITAVSPSWTGAVQQISLPPQGNTESSRVGDNLGDVVIRFRGAISNSNVHLFRLVFFQWLDINSTTPAIGYILDATRSGTVDFVFAPFAEGSKANYHILYDNLFTVSSSLPQPLIDFKVKCRNIDMSASSAVYAQTGSIYVACIQDGSATLNSLTGYCELTYTEATFKQ